MSGNSSAGNGTSKPRPAVANPYLKKKAHIASTSAQKSHVDRNASASATKPHVRAVAGVEDKISAKSVPNNAVTPSKQLSNPSTKANAQHVSSAMKVKHNIANSKPYVTPTPKKLIHQQTATKPPVAAARHVPPAPTKPANHKPAGAMKPALLKPMMSKTGTLKSQLKSQIAALKNQKKQRLLQKEREKQAAIQEAERKKQQEELMRLEKIREAQKKAREEKRRQEEEVKKLNAVRREVRGCLSRIVKSVEVRVNWETRRGVPYEVGEAVQYLVTTVEKNNQSVTSGAYTRFVVPSVKSYHPMGKTGQIFNPMYAVLAKHLVPHPTIPASLPTPKPKTAPQSKPLILHANPLDKYSPFRDSYNLLEQTVCMTKKAGESFGVTLRFESRSVLVPREDDSVEIESANAALKSEVLTVEVAGSAPNLTVPAQLAASALKAEAEASVTLNSSLQSLITQKPRKKRRRRANYGVLTVLDASKATFVLASDQVNQTAASIPGLKSGDIVLGINGRNLGGLTFSEACKAISTTSVENKETGVISCLLRVARLQPPSINTQIKPATLQSGKAFTTFTLNGASLNGMIINATPQVPLIPFMILGDKVSGDFTVTEWHTLVRSLLTNRRKLSTGMALQPILLRDVLAACLREEWTRKILQQRNIESLVMKLAYEGNKIESEMKRLADEHWAAAWKSESDADPSNENNSLFEEPLTDAKRSILRSLARPLAGCRCGSMAHEFVNDPKCVLYRDVKAFVGAGEHENQNVVDSTRKSNTKSKARNAMEAAYVERFVKLRAETEAAKREAEFVLDMEMKQSSQIGKAVFAPRSLCTIVLSAIASMMDEVPGDDPAAMFDSTAIDEASHKKEVEAKPTSISADDDDSSDDEDLPLNALAAVGSKRPVIAAGSTPKRPKLNDNAEVKKNEMVPSPITLAKILKHISKTHGHLFQEPSHIEYAW